MELDQKHLRSFKRWLLANYSARTATKYLADVQTVVQYDGEPPSAKLRRKRIGDYRLAWDVWAAWGGAGELPVARPEVPAKAQTVFSGTNKKIKGGRRVRAELGEQKRLREAVSYNREDYDRILELANAAEGVPARVLEVVGRTGLRIGDVLRADLGALRDGFARDDGQAWVVVKGGRDARYSLRGGGAAEAAWKELLYETRTRPSGWSVAAAVMGDPDASPEAGQGAYTRVEDVCKKLGAIAKASGRIHLHRFRRSVAVYLLQDGATEDQVRQVLLQASSKVLREYSDESRALASAKLVSSLDRDRKKKK